jgi:hypothetical protein
VAEEGTVGVLPPHAVSSDITAQSAHFAILRTICESARNIEKGVLADEQKMIRER